MKVSRDAIIYSIVGFISFVIVFFIIPERSFLPVNDFPNQYFYYAFRDNPLPGIKIVGVAIDDYSLNNISTQWPWRRSVYASVVKNLSAQGVKVIAFDLVFKGEPHDPADEQEFVDALSASKSRIVLGYDFDFKTRSAGLPSQDILGAGVLTGMLNTLMDGDNLIRKMRTSFSLEGKEYFSFSVMAASAYLGAEPNLVSSKLRKVTDLRFQPLLGFIDNYFYINYLVKPGRDRNSVTVVSIYDVINDLDKLKSEYGNDFLKDSIAVVYPAAEVRHDIHFTPVGKIPGGFIHVNGIINILQNRTIAIPGYLTYIFLLFSGLAIFLGLRSGTFQTGLTVFTATLLVNFSASAVLWMAGYKFDFARLVIFGILFFVSGGIYQYLRFFARLNAIKDRATLDPLRGIYTLRYFQYRLDLEVRRRNVYAVVIYFPSLTDDIDGMSFDGLKELWAMMNPVLSNARGFWASLAVDELIGCLVPESPSAMESRLSLLRDALGRVFKTRGLKASVRIAYMKYRREYMFTDICSDLSSQARSASAGVVAMKGPAGLQHGESMVRTEAGSVLLEGLAEDIEEKNRQLLRLFEKLKEEHGRTKEAFYQIISSLVNALEARDPYTQGHSQRVANYALRFADSLGWSEEDKERLRKAALLHDLGKIGIPDSILHKKGALTEEEFGFIKQHEIMAVNILKPLKDIEDILPWILYHHEKWDGTGYPHGLGGDAIPAASQIIALADVFDALTTGRDYKAAVNREDSIALIIKGKGTSFNPVLADKFVAVIRQSNP